jgi:PPOX class probable F420-dependent enzyme
MRRTPHTPVARTRQTVRMSPADLGPADRERIAAARVARLATIRPDGRPHLVPVTFAVLPSSDESVRLAFAVDHKPKRTAALQRLENIAGTPAISLLVDGYDEDWDRLWWFRIDGTARIVADSDEAIDALQEKYDQYKEIRPSGPVVLITADHVASWSAR